MPHLQLVLGVIGFVLAWVGLGLTVLPEVMVRFMALPPVRKVTRKLRRVGHAKA